MVKELDKFYNGKNPLPVIKQYCVAMNSEEIVSIKRCIIDYFYS